MEGATEAWNTLSYGEGFLFTLWIISVYYIKKRIDFYFERKSFKNK